MSVTEQAPAPVTEAPAVEDRPRRPSLDRDYLTELGCSALAAAVLVWTPFHLLGLNAPFGFFLCWFVSLTVIYGVTVGQRHGSLVLKDRLATLFITTSILVAALPLVLVLYYVAVKGFGVIFTNFPSFSFVGQDLHNFGPTDPASKAGMLQAIVGSLEQVGLATLVSLPVGVLAATYLNEIGGRYASVVRTVADAMTGLPTIIAGLFVYVFWIQRQGTKGYSGLAAAMALSVVMLPTIVRTAEEVLRIVSNNLREAALALGSPEWRMVLRVVIPTARTGLVTAAILGVARAVGETAPVLITAFGNPRLNVSPFSGPQDDLPLRIYQLALSASGNDVRVAYGGALLLVLIILTLFALARILGTGGPSSSPSVGRRLAQLLSGPSGPSGSLESSGPSGQVRPSGPPSRSVPGL